MKVMIQKHQVKPHGVAVAKVVSSLDHNFMGHDSLNIPNYFSFDCYDLQTC